MPITLTEADLRAALDVADGARRVEANEDSIQELLALVARLVPADRRYWNRTQTASSTAPIAEVGVPGPEDQPFRPTADVVTEWMRRRPEHPIMSGLHGPVVAVSDVVAAREFHETWLYHECFRPGGLEHEIGVHLSHPAGQVHVVFLSRGPGRDFDERDHLVLRLLRPHLDAAFRRIGFSAPRLTPREAEVLRLVRDGMTNQQIARRMRVRPTTVAKHLEHVYVRTGARSRVQALEICRDVLD